MGLRSEHAVSVHSLRWAAAAAAALLLITTAMPATAIEEPAYAVVQTLPRPAGAAGAAIEIRQYEPYVVAEVTVDGQAEDAGNRAFPILAGYIFGKNKGERRMAMTAPVTQTASPAPMKMAMTAPVTQTPTPGGGFVVQFVLPREVGLDRAPEPLDARVRLREVPPHRLAAIRFSGFWSAANYDEQLTQLRAALAAAGLRASGEPVYSRFDAPWTPWFLRRNEIWLAVEGP